MKFPARSVVWLLPLLLTACFHKTHQTQVQPLAPPVAATPPPAPTPAPAVLPPPVVTIPTQAPPQTTSATLPPQPPPRPPVKHRKPPNKIVQQASNESPGVSAIGQLSSGDPSGIERQTSNSIAATEHALNGINRKLSDQELKTAAQIREFLKQAKAALASGDIDGAHTLALKAKVLLDELTR
jgi:hypothetical protein